jgi:isoleucyl-tRNA synthetase
MRVQHAMREMQKQYKGQRVLVVSSLGVVEAMSVLNGEAFNDVVRRGVDNAEARALTIRPFVDRIADVLDCWFESGSMPYAQAHYPFEKTGKKNALPEGFPADFIAEGLDQTRGWFYTLMVLSSALFKKPAFEHCIVNGIVLAEDGKKMSKRLKNYPEPTELIEKHGADAVRFALMHSPAVRAEDLKFSEKVVEEKVRAVLLPLWNTLSFLTTYANAGGWNPPASLDLLESNERTHFLDRWILIATQDLVNRMTRELEAYELSATCDELLQSIDGLTNWYVRLSRKRFAQKGHDQADACDTLGRVLLTIAKLLAPVCPFIAESIYMNLVGDEHGSIHLTSWPKVRQLTSGEKRELHDMDTTRTLVSLGLKLRADAKLNVRQPLPALHYALPPTSSVTVYTDLVREELNVKEIVAIDDPAKLAEPIVQVNARAVGPRLGKKVQDIIAAAKSGSFTETPKGIEILGELLTPDEACVTYRSREGSVAACEHGIVTTIDTTVTDDLKLEGTARELIRTIQRLRKEAGLSFTDAIVLYVEGFDDVIAAHAPMIADAVRATFRENDGEPHDIRIDERVVTIRFAKAELPAA